MENKKSKKAIMNIDINWGLPLPLHIAPFIFFKLSISYFPLCRSICKSWNHLVLDYAHSFSKFQLPNSIIFSTCDRIPNNPSIFFNPKIHCFDINTLSFVASHTELNIWFIMIRNCCNGLLYIRKFKKDNLITVMCEGIFNPVTYEFFPIPYFRDILHLPLFHGFGFSPKTKQYKIFVVYPNTTCELKMKILRLGSNRVHNKWTSICLPSSISIGSMGVYMNGVIYWIGIENNNKNVNNIYALDVETENFELVMVLEVSYHIYPIKLQLFNGTIYAIIYMSKPIYQIHLWKMQSKRVWIKDFIFCSKFKILPLQFQLLKAFEDGKIAVRIKNSLYWLNYGKKIKRKDKIRTLIPHNRQFTYNYSCLIDSFHFDSIPNILGHD